MKPFTFLAFSLFCAVTPAASQEVPLAAGGHAKFTIVIAGTAADPAHAGNPDRHAADELSRFLTEITGAKFPVVSAKNPVSGPKLLVGAEAAVAVITPHEIATLGHEGYIVRFKGVDFAIAGGAPRGTLYGVYSFLEDRLGCRWFTPDVSVIPKSAEARVSTIEKRYVPPLEYRATDYFHAREADWAARNKLNGTQTRIDALRGGKIEYSHFVHTFNEILNPAQHFKAHPEYFSEVDGKRIADKTQLCLTNPQVLDIATKTVRRWMHDAPQATIFSVSQNDWLNPCSCANCRKAYEEEGGAWSGPLLRFVDAIAAKLASEFPDKAIDTLAYQFTRQPPSKVTPLPNVIVRLCSIECCFSHPLEAPEELDPANAAFARDIQAWSKISKRLYIWDYVIDYSHSIQPFPNLRSLAPNIRFFVRNGVKGVYEEADYFSPGGELAELRAWIIAKTLWDPEYDTQRAIDEFLKAYYGAAAEPISDYINELHDRATAQQAHFDIWTPPNAEFFSPELLAHAEAHFDEAEKAVAADATLQRRVQLARLPVKYVRLMRLGESFDGAHAPSAEVRDEARRLLSEFEAVATREGVTMVSEGQAFAGWRDAIRKALIN